jgi:hypothetical protein
MPQNVRDYFASKSTSPRVRLAARLYASGACKTMGEASVAAGLSKQYLALHRENSEVQGIVQAVDQAIAEGTVDFSKVLATLGRQAVRNIAHLMEDAQSEAIRFKAAQDLADRSPETTKVHKHEISGGLEMSSADAQNIAKALVEAARLKSTFPSAAEGDFITTSNNEIALLGPGEQ